MFNFVVKLHQEILHILKIDESGLWILSPSPSELACHELDEKDNKRDSVVLPCAELVTPPSW